MRGRRKQDRRLAALMIAGGTLTVLAPVVWVADRTGAAVLSGVFGGAFTFAVLAYTAAGLLAVIEAGRALMREGSR